MSVFSIMPIEAFQDKRLTLQHIRVLGTLLSFRSKNTNVVWPSRAEISSRCGMHQSNISVATSDLVRLGWLEKDGKGGFSKATRYRIVVPDLHVIVAEGTTVNKQTTVVDSATVVDSTTVVDPATVVDSATVAEGTTRGVVDSATRMRVVDSATRIEETIEETNRRDNIAAGVSPQAAPKKKSSLSPEMKESCRKTLDGYSKGYFARYQIEPITNAKVFSQIVAFVKRVGQQDAPFVAEWFPSHKSAYCVGRGHAFGVLLEGAEKFRTEWATGRMVTNTLAQQSDKTESNHSAAQEAKRMLERKSA